MPKLYNAPNTSKNGHLAQKLRAIKDIDFSKKYEKELKHPHNKYRGPPGTTVRYRWTRRKAEKNPEILEILENPPKSWIWNGWDPRE